MTGLRHLKRGSHSNSAMEANRDSDSYSIKKTDFTLSELFG